MQLWLIASMNAAGILFFFGGSDHIPGSSNAGNFVRPPYSFFIFREACTAGHSPAHLSLNKYWIVTVALKLFVHLHLVGKWVIIILKKKDTGFVMIEEQMHLVREGNLYTFS